MTNLIDTSAEPNKLSLSQQVQQSFNHTNQILTTKEMTQKKIIVKFSKLKEQEDFVKRLIDFHRHKSVNTPITHWPSLNGKPIDLYQLYINILAAGGWERTCEKNKWEDIWKKIELEHNMKPCFNGSHALKLIYVRYLSLYEKFDTHLGSINEQLNSYNLTQLLNSSTSFFLAHNKLSSDSERVGAGDDATLGNF